MRYLFYWRDPLTAFVSYNILQQFGFSSSKLFKNNSFVKYLNSKKNNFVKDQELQTIYLVVKSYKMVLSIVISKRSKDQIDVLTYPKIQKQ